MIEIKNVFSHKIYELFLKVCTEFESNCRGILKANDKKCEDIKDYF